MGDYTVYMHVFPNGKKYVGITSQDVSRRWRDGKGYEGQVVYGAICSRTIGYVANHDKRYKTAGGYHWKYKEVA